MAQYVPDELVFMDETSKDERTLCRQCGHAKESRRVNMKGVFIRGRRLTAIAAMSCEGIIAGHIVEGSLHCEGFLHFLEHSVLLQCEAYPGKHSVLVMDNACIHHGAQVYDLAERFG
ncbi:hypothetical protein PAXRUDRAFT_40042, partial [Paxillus rubicundulus Ve08.2h10]